MICKICDQDKPAKAFPAHSRRCKACKSAYERERRAASTDREAARMPERQTKHDRACAEAGIWFGPEALRPRAAA